jgi:1-acyl-sn-glycerol-3-phosphate acyltransferase
MEKYSVPLANRIFRFIVRPAFRLIFVTLAKVKVTGKQNVPMKGACIVAINHVSTFDPPFVAAMWPRTLEGMGASELWERKGIRILVSGYGGIRVHRGEYDRNALEQVFNVLGSGYPLLIAPEGGRTHKPGMRQALPGVAYLMDEAKVPIVPVGVVGTTDDFAKNAFGFKHPSLEVNIGKPIILPPIEGRGQERRDNRQRNADLVMRHIAGLLPEEYRGVYLGQEIYQ